MRKADWLDTNDYPFESHIYECAIGRMHYVDVGSGDPIVFVHGNPSWSYEYRNVIKALSGDYRCIAPDHIGFGLSDKPLNWTYTPQDHAKNLEMFLEDLDLMNITIVVGDWGGPIGLSYAIKHPDRIKNIVISNTWAWSVKNDWYYQLFSKFTGGIIGRWLIKKYNFFANVIVKMAFGDRAKLTSKIHKHYLMPLGSEEERKGSYVFPKQIIESSDWLESIENKLSSLNKKAIVISWGMKDIAFREKELKRWIGIFPEARVIKYADAGHFVCEEKPADVVKLLKDL